jgi:hypothetical protein
MHGIPLAMCVPAGMCEVECGFLHPYFIIIIIIIMLPNQAILKVSVAVTVMWNQLPFLHHLLACACTSEGTHFSVCVTWQCDNS